MASPLQEQVFQANLELVRHGLVILTFGNVSGIDRAAGLVAIKPSGVPYDSLRAQDMVLVDLTGRVVEGELHPSSDTPAHLEIYKAFADVGGIAHAHSRAATAFAQAGREIPCFGTTHADLCNGPVPVTRALTEAEVAAAYEANTGRVIVERLAGLKPLETPAALVAGHGPFAWGRTPEEAVRNALVLETIAAMALDTVRLAADTPPLPDYVQRKHFERKHGARAYYGQAKERKP